MTGDEVASLFASLGLQVNTAQWAAGNSQIASMQRKLGEFQDAQGRWRASSGRYLSSNERAALGLSNGLGKVGHEAKDVSEQLDSLWKLAAVGLAVAGVERVEHALIGFNQEVQDSKISLSAMISGMTGAEWTKAEGQADALYNEFQRFSTLTPVTTQQILEFGQGIAAATFAAGGGVKELKNLTEQGVIASKVLAGSRGAGYAQLEFTELLSGNINKRMIFAKQLLAMGHMTEEAFKALDGHGRIAALQKILNSDAMNHARDALGESFTGVTSTLWDNLQIAFGKVGKPLFDQIIARVKELNEWMQANKATVEEYARKIGDRLVGAFDLLVTAFRFVTDHATFFEGLLIGMGAFITAFAIQAAIDWAIAFWPITLAIAAIAVLHSAINWLFDDLDEASDSVGATATSVDTLDNAKLDTLNDAFDGVKSTADKARDAINGVTKATQEANAAGGQLHDQSGAAIDKAWLQRAQNNFETPHDQAVEALAASRESNRVMFGPATGEPAFVPSPSRSASSMPGAAATAANITVTPQLNVTVTGNMPAEWIDTKIDTKIQDHHAEVLNNAGYALQAEDDE